MCPSLPHSQPLCPQSPILTATATLLLIAGSAMDCLPAPKRSGSTHQVSANWETHTLSCIDVNTFSDHGLNTENCVTLHQCAQTNNLLNAKGWKQFKKHASEEPTPANHTSLCVTKQTMIFFEQALHAHQINKVVHSETPKLCEHAALLQSSVGQC